MTDDWMAELEAGWEERRQRERWYKPGVWMLWALKRKTEDHYYQAKYACQRAFRGWDDRAVFSLDSQLTKMLGETLVRLAEVAHGFPPNYGGEVRDALCIPDDDHDIRFLWWTGDIRKHGEALLTYCEKHGELYGDEWTAVYEPAREAFRWIADNLPALWD